MESKAQAECCASFIYIVFILDSSGNAAVFCLKPILTEFISMQASAVQPAGRMRAAD